LESMAESGLLLPPRRAAAGAPYPGDEPPAPPRGDSRGDMVGAYADVAPAFPMTSMSWKRIMPASLAAEEERSRAPWKQKKYTQPQTAATIAKRMSQSTGSGAFSRPVPVSIACRAA